MRTERVTVTMPTEQANQLRQAVAAGNADSVSSYVADAVRERLARDQALSRLEQAMGGRPPAEALSWARRTLGVDQNEPGQGHDARLGRAKAS